MARLEVMGGRGGGRFERASADYPITTFAWAAPEMLFGGEQTDAVDIYALGVVLWEIVTHVSGLIGGVCCFTCGDMTVCVPACSMSSVDTMWRE